MSKALTLLESQNLTSVNQVFRYLSSNVPNLVISDLFKSQATRYLATVNDTSDPSSLIISQVPQPTNFISMLELHCLELKPGTLDYRRPKQAAQYLVFQSQGYDVRNVIRSAPKQIQQMERTRLVEIAKLKAAKRRIVETGVILEGLAVSTPNSSRYANNRAPKKK